MRKLENIPTNVVLGFLGVGKTSAILDWLRQKPAGEKWAVLVNEFGEIGIDGAIYSQHGVAIKEIPGGCMCCAQGVPMQVAVNRLLRETRPDRLLIETSGIGHPLGVLKTLQGKDFGGVLDMRAVVALVDPEQLLHEACLRSELFMQQLAVSDVLVANKSDLASARAIDAFDSAAAGFRIPKALAVATSHAEMQLEWLDYQHSDRSADPVSTLESIGPQSHWQTFHWQYPAAMVFELDALRAWIGGLNVVRLKGFLNTDKGSYGFNLAAGVLRVEPMRERGASRVQIIDWPCQDPTARQRRQRALEQDLQACLQTASAASYFPVDSGPTWGPV